MDFFSKGVLILFKTKDVLFKAVDTLNSRGNDLPREYKQVGLGLTSIHGSIFTGTERCQCNEVIWKAVTGVLIFINILLVVVIVWQHMYKRGNELTSYHLLLIFTIMDYVSFLTSTNHFICPKM